MKNPFESFYTYYTNYFVLPVDISYYHPLNLKKNSKNIKSLNGGQNVKIDIFYEPNLHKMNSKNVGIEFTKKKKQKKLPISSGKLTA